MNGIRIGSYRPGSSLLHSMDPRGKLLSFLILTAAVILTDSWMGYLLLLALLVLLCWKGGISSPDVLSAILGLKWFYLTVFLINALFFASETPIWHWWIFNLSHAGIIQGIRVILRIIPILVLSNLLMLTTRPQELTGGISALLSPLALFRVPVNDIAMILSVSLQFIPILLEEGETIKMAQTARGAEFESGSLLRRARAFLPLILPLFLAAFQRAEDLSVAMEARGYRTGSTRRRRAIPMQLHDRIAVAASLLIAGTACLL